MFYNNEFVINIRYKLIIHDKNIIIYLKRLS